MPNREEIDAVVIMVTAILGGLGLITVAFIKFWRDLKKALQTNHGSVSIGDATDRQTEQLHEQSEQLQQIEGQVAHMADGLAGHDKFRADTAAVLERQNTTLADLAKATAELAAGFKAQAAAQEQANYQINLLLKQGLMKGPNQ